MSDEFSIGCCVKCRFEKDHHCRRYPKSPVVSIPIKGIIGSPQQFSTMWSYPPVREDEYGCGEYREKK